MGMQGGLLALSGLAFVLGMRHGLDADHLATIDGFVRRQPDPRLARLSGMLFSLGHGMVVMLVAAIAAILTGAHDLPSWLEVFGTSVSIGFLLLLGGLNLHQVWTTPAGQAVAPLGLRSRWFDRTSSSPAMVVAVGALFALSFDTLSQAVLFSLAASGQGGLAAALLLAGLFMLGMMTTDALNGAWVAWLVRRADARAALASRVMGMAVGLSSLGIALFGIARLGGLSWPQAEEVGIWCSASVVLLLLAAYTLAMRVGSRAQLVSDR